MLQKIYNLCRLIGPIGMGPELQPCTKYRGTLSPVTHNVSVQLT